MALPPNPSGSSWKRVAVLVDDAHAVAVAVQGHGQLPAHPAASHDDDVHVRHATPPDARAQLGGAPAPMARHADRRPIVADRAEHAEAGDGRAAARVRGDGPSAHPEVDRAAAFSSDAISSTAYATEEILFVVALGASSLTLGLSKLVPIAIVVAVLLAIVVFSYRQTIFAYPNGGGSYIVSREHLGEMPVAGGRRVAAGRLRAHRRGVHLRRRGRHHLDPDLPRPRRAPGPACAWA